MQRYLFSSRLPSRVALGVALALLSAYGQAPAVERQQPSSANIVLNVTALDSKGRPLTDLTSAEFQILDEGKPQTIASFTPNATQPATTLVLWDLLNGMPDRQHYTNLLLVKALEPLEKGDSVYVYILTNEGALYPIHGIQPAQPASAEANPSAIPWTKQAGPLLDQAIKKVYGLKNEDALNLGSRTATTLQRFGGISEFFAQISGPKTIVWITRGVPTLVAYSNGCKDASFIGTTGNYLAGNCTLDCRHVQEGKCVDYTPFVRHLARALNGTGTVIDAVEETPEGVFPPSEPGTASDTLRQVTNLTGGRMYTDGQIETAVAQSIGDVRGRYQIAYVATPDGKFHKLKVTCLRKGVKVEAPKGIFAELK
jgi:VWFA-related protein